MLDNISPVQDIAFFGMSPADYIKDAAWPEAITYAHAMLLKENLLIENSPEFIEEQAFIIWDLEQLAANAIYNSLSDVDKVEYMRLIDEYQTAKEAMAFANSRIKDLPAVIMHAWDNFKYQWEQTK